MGDRWDAADPNQRNYLEVAAALRMSRRRFLQGATAVGIVSATTPLLAACAASSATSTPGLGGGGSATVYYVGWEGEDGSTVDYLTKWRTDNSVDLNATYAASPDEMLAKIATDPAHCDITTTHIEAYAAAITTGLLEPLDLSKLPNFDSFFPAFKSDHWVSGDGQRYCIPAAWGDSPIVYDPAKWDGVPDRFYPDLAGPDYKDQLIIMDDPYTNLFDVAQALGHPNPCYLTQPELDDVVRAFKEIRNNVVAIAAGSLNDLVDPVVRGDASMIPFQGWEPMINMGKDKGKELKFATPKVTPGFWWVDCYGITKASDHKDAVYAYVNELISPEGQAGCINYNASGCTQSKSFDLVDPTIRGWYPYDVVREASLPSGHPLTVSLDPPAEDKGDIVGVAAWKRAWQEAKLG